MEAASPAELADGAPYVAGLVPSLRQKLPDLPPPVTSPESEHARFYLFDATARFLKNRARSKPLLLVLDDLHWADKPSLLLLEFLGRELADASLLVVGTYREAEAREAGPLAGPLADLLGGATAYPRAKGVWRDDERGGALVKDEPVVVHCYTTPLDIEASRNLAELGGFCRRMGREARQGEVGLVVGDEYFAIRDFAKE